MKRRTIAPGELPWMIPVRVRAAGYTPVFPKDEAYNVEVSSTNPIYSDNTRLVPGRDLLWCDLQSSPSTTNRGRLGSGRSGIYRGKYLKGMGRTPLAANWNNADRYHNSGHLLPSAALRELLVSSYLSAVGERDCIVPCEGVLFRALHPELTRFPRIWKDQASVPAIDHAFQAISVKPATFIRFTNIMWQMENLLGEEGKTPVAENLVSVVALLSECLEVALPEATGLPASEPARFLELMARAFERMESHLAAFRRAGMYWGSQQNNFTVEGRFLDLEVSGVLGIRSLCALGDPDGKDLVFPLEGRLVGLERLHYMVALRQFVRHFEVQLEYHIGSMPYWRPSTKDFLSNLLEGWRQRFSTKGVWFQSKRETLRRLWTELLGELEPPRSARSVLRETFRYVYERFTSEAVPGDAGLLFTRLETKAPFQLEPGRYNGLYTWDGLRPSREELETFSFFCELFEDLHRETDLDRLLRRTREAHEKILRTFARGRHPQPKTEESYVQRRESREASL